MTAETPTITVGCIENSDYAIGGNLDFQDLNLNVVGKHQAPEMIRRRINVMGSSNHLELGNAARVETYPNVGIDLDKEPPMAQVTRRLVRVVIIDPNDNIPVERCLLYNGQEQLTDLTEQELFFEIDLKSILDKHNEYRKTLVNKAIKDRTEHLEPARIRDLSMKVVVIAQF